MNYKALVIGTLSQDSFVSVNKRLAKRLGFVEAGLLAELIFTHKGVAQNQAFFDEGKQGEWFFLTQAKVEEELGIKRREHENAIKKLVAAEVIYKKQMGLPAKSYYVINWRKIVDIVDNSDETPPEPAPQSDCTKRTNKDERNVQTGMDETYKQESTKGTSIHINKKKLEEKEIKKINNKKIVNKGISNPTLNSFKRAEVPHTISDYDGTEPYGNFIQNIANEFYTEFSVGRWSKKQWQTIVNRISLEIISDERSISNHRKYIYSWLKKIAYSHDLKNGKIEIEYNGEGTVPFYDWLTTREDDDMPW